MEFRVSKLKLAGLFLLGAMTCSALYVAGRRGSTGGYDPTLLIVFSPFEIALVVWSIGNLLRSGPTIVIDGRGFGGPRIPSGAITWEEIRFVYWSSFSSPNSIGVSLTDFDALVSRLSPLRRIGLLLSPSKPPIVTIFFSALTPDAADAYYWIKQHFPNKAAT